MVAKTTKAERRAAARAKRDQASEHRTPQHIVKREAFDGAARITMRVVQDPLDRLEARGYITKRQWMAGDRLRADYLLGVEGARDSDHAGGSGQGIGPGEAQLMALTEYRRAVRSIGKRRSAIVLPVVCGVTDLGGVAAARRDDPKRVAGEFSGALDDLAAHYGYPSDGSADRQIAESALSEWLRKAFEAAGLDRLAAMA